MAFYLSVYLWNSNGCMYSVLSITDSIKLAYILRFKQASRIRIVSLHSPVYSGEHVGGSLRSQSINYVHLPVNIFQKRTLHIIQYKYLEFCFQNLILDDLFLCTILCGTSCIIQPNLAFAFTPDQNGRAEIFVPVGYQLPRGIWGNQPLINFAWFIRAGGTREGNTRLKGQFEHNWHEVEWVCAKNVMQHWCEERQLQGVCDVLGNIYIHTHIPTYTNTDVCMCTYIYMYVYICIHMYIYTFLYSYI